MCSCKQQCIFVQQTIEVLKEKYSRFADLHGESVCIIYGHAIVSVQGNAEEASPFVGQEKQSKYTPLCNNQK